MLISLAMLDFLS